MINKYITLPKAQSLLQPDRVPAFVRALKNSMHVWNTTLSQSQLVLSSSTRAGVINDYWYYFANQQLGGKAGISVQQEQLQRFLVVDDQLIVRFKLVDQNLRSRNYPTSMSKNWNNQLPLKGIPSLSRCEFGYRLTLTGTAIEDAFLLLRSGEKLLWVWQVFGSQIDTIPIQLPFPSPGQPQPSVFAYTDLSSV